MQAVLASSGEELAANILRLCLDETQREGVLAADGHLALITLLHAGPDSNTTKHAVGALVYLSHHVHASQLPIVQAGAVAPIVALLRTAPTASNQNVLANAALLVANLAQTSAGIIEAFQKASAIATLVPLLGAASEIAMQAAGALWNLSCDVEAKKVVNVAEILEAGAIPPLVALLHGETARQAAGALRNLAAQAAGTSAIRSAGGIVPLVALLHAEAETAENAAGALDNMSAHESRPTILAALAARPPPPRPAKPRATTGQTSLLSSLLRHDDRPHLARLLTFLRRIATERLATAEAGDDDAALQQAIDQAAAVRVADTELQRARTKLAAVREAAEAARRERRTSLGLDELKTPDEFVCPITYEVMQDPVVASDGHTYERSAIEEVLALPEERRKSPLTREPLQAALFPNRALKNRIAAHEQEAEALAEKVAQKTREAGRVASRKRPSPAGAEVIKLEEDSPGEGASSSSAAAGGGKRGRRK